MRFRKILFFERIKYEKNCSYIFSGVTCDDFGKHPICYAKWGGGNSPKTANSSLKYGWWQTSSKDKQGRFIGGELGFSNGWIGQNSIEYIIGGDSTFVPHINMIGGYQWYFLDKPWLHLGLRLKGYLGYSNYSVDNSHHLSNITSHTIHTGIEVGAIYDFVQYKEHTLGV